MYSIKQPSSLGGALNRKKSVEKVGTYLPEASPHNGSMGGQAPYQIYKHANGKIELRSISNNNGGHTKLRPSHGGGQVPALQTDLDVQGKSVAT